MMNLSPVWGAAVAIILLGLALTLTHIINVRVG